jgi:antitoxin component YwqK of YwqJK toxin-antitoxin module
MKIFSHLLLILISASFSQEAINYETTLIKKGQLFYTKDTNKPYSGPVFSLYDDRKKKEEGSLKDGEMISKTIWKWYKNGQKWSEGKYNNGKVDRSFTFWYENGQKNYEENYKDGIKVGSWYGWYENGQKNSERAYIDGKRDGLWASWYENGQKSSERIYKDGKIDGLDVYWYENGQKYREMTYQDGELINEIYWTENGLDSGDLIFHFKNGEIWKKGNLKNGKLDGEFIEYGFFGTEDIYHKRILQNYKDGKLDGEYNNYFGTGDVNVMGNYKDGKLEGRYTYYDKDGKIYWEGIYKDDVLVEETSFIGSKGPFRLN